jgi:hypothetical protein
MTEYITDMWVIVKIHGNELYPCSMIKIFYPQSRIMGDKVQNNE